VISVCFLFLAANLARNPTIAGVVRAVVRRADGHVWTTYRFVRCQSGSLSFCEQPGGTSCRVRVHRPRFTDPGNVMSCFSLQAFSLMIPKPTCHCWWTAVILLREIQPNLITCVALPLAMGAGDESRGADAGCKASWSRSCNRQ
jgi:hypothetical protein